MFLFYIRTGFSRVADCCVIVVTYFAYAVKYLTLYDSTVSKQDEVSANLNRQIHQKNNIYHIFYRMQIQGQRLSDRLARINHDITGRDGDHIPLVVCG